MLDKAKQAKAKLGAIKRAVLFLKKVGPIYLGVVLLSLQFHTIFFLFVKNDATPNTCPYSQHSLGFQESGKSFLSFASIIDTVTGIVYAVDGSGFIPRYRNAILENYTFQSVKILLLVLVVVLTSVGFVFGLLDISTKDLFKRMLIIAFFIWGTTPGSNNVYDTVLTPLVFEVTDEIAWFFSRGAGFVVDNPQFQQYLENNKNGFAVMDSIVIITFSETLYKKISALVFHSGFFLFLAPIMYLVLFYLWFAMLIFAILIAIARIQIAIGLGLFPIFLPFMLFDIGYRTKIGIKDKLKNYFEGAILQPAVYTVISLYIGSVIVALIISCISEMFNFPGCYHTYYEPSGLSWLPFFGEFLTFRYWKVGAPISLVNLVVYFSMMIFYVMLFKNNAMEWAKGIADSLSAGMGGAKSPRQASPSLTSSLYDSATETADGIQDKLLGSKTKDPVTGQTVRRGGVAGFLGERGGKVGKGVEGLMRGVGSSGLPLAAMESAGGLLYKSDSNRQNISASKYHSNNEAAKSGKANSNYEWNLSDKEQGAANILKDTQNSMPDASEGEVRTAFNNRLRESDFSEKWIQQNSDRIMDLKPDEGGSKHYDDRMKYFAHGIRQSEDGDLENSYKIARQMYVEDKLDKDPSRSKKDLERSFDCSKDFLMNSKVAKREWNDFIGSSDREGFKGDRTYRGERSALGQEGLRGQDRIDLGGLGAGGEEDPELGGSDLNRDGADEGGINEALGMPTVQGSFDAPEPEPEQDMLDKVADISEEEHRARQEAEDAQKLVQQVKEHGKNNDNKDGGTSG